MYVFMVSVFTCYLLKKHNSNVTHCAVQCPSLIKIFTLDFLRMTVIGKRQSESLSNSSQLS